MEGKTILTLVVLLLTSLLVHSNKHETEEKEHKCSGDHCHAGEGAGDTEQTVEEASEEDGPCIVEFPDLPSLFRWDPVELGHEREIALIDGRKTKMITRAKKPPIFELPNFLSDEECDHIIKLAKDSGLKKSFIHNDPKTIAHREKIQAQFKAIHDIYKYYDFNADGSITKPEIRLFCERYKYVFMSDEEMEKMIASVNLTQLDDGVISQDEIATTPWEAMEDFYNDLKYNHPYHRDRYSEQTWLSQSYEYRNDKVLAGIRYNVMSITGLSSKIVYGGEPLQVVHYGVRGHYHAHYDSTSKSFSPDYDCCHYDVSKTPKCRLCRFVTILYYLNDVEEGGETAFPVADFEHFNESEYRERKEGDMYNLSHYCHKAAVVIKPKKGKAIMWYNHVLRDGWLGEKDSLSLHGGCDILKGEKWVANNWLPAAELEGRHIISDYYNRNMPY